jgi:adenylate cyclase
MKRCPQCGREYDNSMIFCLDDGVELLYGPALGDEPATAILSEPRAVATGLPPGESSPRGQVHTTDQTAIFPRRTEAEPQGRIDNVTERQSLSVHRAAQPLVAFIAVLVILIGGFFGYRYFASAGSNQINSIAVMPFVNESGNTDVEYLSDGMTETLIGSLSKLPNLNVKARSSVFRYKGKDLDIKSVARDLNVEAILTGRVSQRGENLVVTLELADTQTENTLWSEKYNRRINDLFDVQEEIAGDVSEKLRIRLTGPEKEELAKRSTDNLKAFQYYIQGRSHVHRRTREDLLEAIRCYRKATEEDRNYALAYAGLSEAYAQLGLRGYILAMEGRQQALDAVRTSLALDENLAEAHVANGLIPIVFPPHDFSLGDREMRRAIELSPSLAIAHFYSGVSLVRQGRLDEAFEKNQKARELDPLSAIIARQVVIHYFFKRDYAQAVEHLRQANQLGPSFSVGWEVGVYVQNRLLDEAGSELEKAQRDRKDDPILIYSTGAIFAARGERAEALKIVKKLEDMSGERLTQAHLIAKLYSGLNDKESTFSWLNRGLDAGAIGAFYPDEPVWDPIRNDARFNVLLRQMGIPERW